jgi:hypothetical protein
MYIEPLTFLITKSLFNVLLIFTIKLSLNTEIDSIKDKKGYSIF